MSDFLRNFILMIVLLLTVYMIDNQEWSDESSSNYEKVLFNNS